MGCRRAYSVSGCKSSGSVDKAKGLPRQAFATDTHLVCDATVIAFVFFDVCHVWLSMHQLTHFWRIGYDDGSLNNLET